jgi:hypothetical protein
MNLNFDSRGVAPAQPMEPVPEGWYPVVISDEEPKQVKDKPHSWYLSLTMDIIDGPMKGRKLYANLNLGNDNQQAVEIAQRELSAICHVTHQYVLNEQTGGTAALKGKPFMVKAVVEASRNAIKGYKDMQGNDPGKTGGQTAAPAPAAPPTPPPSQPQAYAPAAAQPSAPAWSPQPAAAAPQPPQFGPPGGVAPAWGGAPAPAAPPQPAAAPAWSPQPAAAAPSAPPWAR